MAYSTIVTKDEGAVIIVDNIDTKRNKAEHKIRPPSSSTENKRDHKMSRLPVIGSNALQII